MERERGRPAGADVHTDLGLVAALHKVESPAAEMLGKKSSA
jgi:hypothetical protein